MKLRLRSIESKETLKIEVSNPYTLRHLKQILSQNLPNSPSPASIRLSLNRKDELQSAAADGEDSLQFVGVAAGDLVFFSLDPNSVQNSPVVPDPVLVVDSSLVENSPPDAGDILGEPKISESDTVTQSEESMDFMESDDGCDDSYHIDDGSSVKVVEKSFSVPGYLRKVFMDEFDDGCGRDDKLSFVAIHAVLLESGFVAFDRNSNEQIDGFQFKNDWPSCGVLPDLLYTLPDIVARGDGIDYVLLKFNSLGRIISVYGSLGCESRGSSKHVLRLNKDQVVPLLNVVWANCGVTESVVGVDGSVSSTSPEKELFKFWRDVKDKLALPLLIGLCEKTGLELPPCFIRLPTDLKLKILELLPGVDVAKISCVCLELRYLASSDDLWKLKFDEEFRIERTEGYGSWKKEFAAVLQREKDRELEDRRIIGVPRRRIRHPNPFIIPRGPPIIGDPRDIWPAFGGDTRPRFRGPGNYLRHVYPRCRLGGQSSRDFI